MVEIQLEVNENESRIVNDVVRMWKMGRRNLKERKVEYQWLAVEEI